MVCANCGVTSPAALSTNRNTPRRCHQADAMTSLVQPLVFDNTVTVLQGLEDLFDLNIDLNQALMDLKGMMPQLCEFCTYLLAQAHSARSIFLKRSKEDSYVVKLMTPNAEKPKPGKSNPVEEVVDRCVVKEEPGEFHEVSDTECDVSFDPLEMCETEEDACDTVRKCPECNKSFKSLERHMSLAHDLDYEPDQGQGGRPEDRDQSDTSDEEDEVPKRRKLNKNTMNSGAVNDNTITQMNVEELQKHVSNQLKRTSLEIESIKQNVRSVLMNASASSLDIAEDRHFSWPINSKEELAGAETYLETSANFQAEVARFTRVGASGKNITTTVNSILRHIFSSSFALQVRLTTKIPLLETKLFILIKDAVKCARMDRTTTDALIQKYVGKWLRSSCDRKGGGKDRTKKRINKV